MPFPGRAVPRRTEKPTRRSANRDRSAHTPQGEEEQEAFLMDSVSYDDARSPRRGAAAVPASTSGALHAGHATPVSGGVSGGVA